MSFEGRPENKKSTTLAEERVPNDMPVTSDPTREGKLVRKLDRRILPITCLMYLFACGC
jgi:hypothetical protein